MLLRQLHRPLARSVAATRPSSPSWRIAQRTALLHGSGPSRQQKSLLEQLFPGETTQHNDGPEKEVRWASRLLNQDNEMPSLDIKRLSDLVEDFTTAGVVDPELFPENDIDPDSLQVKSVLILSGVSSNLAESDFLRLGAKGKHVEGWIRGVVKVIQARNPDTLQPLGRYFILFDRPEAAIAYREEVLRLRNMGKQYVPGAHHSRRSDNPQSLPPPGLTDDDEDIISTIRSFTLVPPSGRYNLEVFHPPSSETARGGDENIKTYKKLDSLRRGRSFADALYRLCGSRFLVLIRLDGGHITVDTLRNAIYADNKDRNLPWRILPSPASPSSSSSAIHTSGDGEPPAFILPFGKSMIKSWDRMHETAEGKAESGATGGSESQTAAQELEQWGREASKNSDTLASAMTDDATQQSDEVEEEEGHAKETAESEQVPISSSADNDRKGWADNGQKHRQYMRFLVPFADEAEARRFVREWHRRELTIHESNHGDGFGVGAREDNRVVNTSMLW